MRGTISRPKPKLRQVLDEQGRSTIWLARELGLAQPRFSHIMYGDFKVPPLFYERAAALLNVPIARILPDPERDEVAA